jgi:hypothetical protein
LSRRIQTSEMAVDCMFRELETVVLRRDLDDHGLKEGDVGVVVHSYSDGAAYEVEFVTAEGRTVAVLTLDRSEIRLMEDKEILHVRAFSGASN